MMDAIECVQTLSIIWLVNIAVIVTFLYFNNRI